jgi:hypothetical protein
VLFRITIGGHHFSVVLFGAGDVECSRIWNVILTIRLFERPGRALPLRFIRPRRFFRLPQHRALRAYPQSIAL